MSSPSSIPRSSPYAALVSQKACDAPAHDRAGSGVTLPQPDPFLLEESKKLQQLKNALWDAFLASGSTAIPLPLIDLTFAYTGTLKLQLSLLSASESRHR